MEHAAAASVFTIPTINGYKRFRPYSFAPGIGSPGRWRTGRRSSVVIGGPGDETAHVENRAGEPCANPYLYMASQIVCGLDGIAKRSDPGPLEEAPYESTRPKPAQLLHGVGRRPQAERPVPRAAR